jgi:hypothetical protein
MAVGEGLYNRVTKKRKAGKYSKQYWKVLLVSERLVKFPPDQTVTWR